MAANQSARAQTSKTQVKDLMYHKRLMMDESRCLGVGSARVVRMLSEFGFDRSFSLVMPFGAGCAIEKILTRNPKSHGKKVKSIAIWWIWPIVFDV